MSKSKPSVGAKANAIVGGTDGGIASRAALTTEQWTTLSRPLDRVLGKRSANALAKLDLHTVGDLLDHVPFRLARRGELLPIESVSAGDSVTVVARVMSARMRPMNNRRGFILNVSISDGEHDLDLTFFGKSSRPLKYHEMQLSPGTVATFSGTISSYRGQLQLSHPEYELLEDESEVDPDKIARPIPIYHAAQKVPSWHIEKAVAVILPSLTEADLPDPLPKTYRRTHGLPSRFEAVMDLHRPQDEDSWHRAAERMKHEEAFVLQMVLAQRAATARETAAPACPPRQDGIAAAFENRLPFALTDGQTSVGAELSEELGRSEPMRRLLQGDVGSGKTIVALRAMLQAIDAGHQAVLIAPTEVLAHQHLATIEKLLGELGRGGQLGAPDHATKVQLLTGSMTQKQKRQALANIASGAAGLIIGTHALLQDNVQIPFLALAVVDEQHRFGVDQRDKLAAGAHLLVMTATPIPRTIAMTSFGDLEVSTLSELPAGRSPITTNLVPAFNERWMQRTWQRAREELDAGGRVYVVCPRISATESEVQADVNAGQASNDSSGDGMLPIDLSEEMPKKDMASVEQTLAELKAHPALAGVEIGYVHGRLTTDEKDAAMQDFSLGMAPVLVTTTVIEVGVDVPEATLMVILDADRFGLSQLHQLRGRVGRGSKPGLCLAVFSAPEGTLAYDRLEAFASTTDGFVLAERDLELRSEGDVLGAVQSGRRSSLRFLRVSKDADIIATTRQAAYELLHNDPDLSEHAELARVMEEMDAEHTQYLERG